MPENEFFQLMQYRVAIEEKDGIDSCEATVKVKIGDTLEHKVAEGNGPVNALDNAFRIAIESHIPELKKIFLRDYKVKIVETIGTKSTVDVSMEFCDDRSAFWQVAHRSTDIIKASVYALLEGFRKGIRRIKSQGPS